MTGKFITFEGIEGAGKSTQIDMLTGALGAQRASVLRSREPGGTRLGQEIRKLLLDSAAAPRVSSMAEVLLYAADRAQHMAEVVEPGLKNNKLVLCDRHIDSLIAYQAFGRGLDRDLVDQLNRIATRGRLPDLTVYLDLDPEIGLARVASRGARDRLEHEDVSFHTRVRNGYLLIATEFSARIRSVPADRPAKDVHADVLALVRQILVP